MKELTIRPGAILIWKEYNFFTKLWNKIRFKELPFNRCSVQTTNMEMITSGKHFDEGRWLLYEPRKLYSKVERQKLLEVLREYTRLNSNSPSNLEQIAILNLVRPDTFDMANTTLDNIGNNKYYRRVHAIQVRD